MGKPVHRVGDMGCQHGAFPPTVGTQGSNNVMANSMPVRRLGDMFAIHGSPNPYDIPPHPAINAMGSMSVMVNSMPILRQGDPVMPPCMGKNDGGSNNVMAG